MRKNATDKEIEEIKKALAERYKAGADSRLKVYVDAGEVQHIHNSMHRAENKVLVEELGFGGAARITPVKKNRDIKSTAVPQRTKRVQTEEGETVTMDMKVLKKFAAPKEPGAMLCPEHENVKMVYLSHTDTFACPVEDCHVGARRRITLADDYASKEDENGNVVDSVYRGRLEMVKDTDGKPYLHLIDIGALIDLTEFMKAAGGAVGTEPNPKG